MIAWTLLGLYIALLFVCLPKVFAKAGLPAWKGAVPVYNLIVWNKILGKPWYWLILLLAPGVNLLMLIIYNVNTSIVLGKRDLKDHVIMTVLPWVELPKLAFGAPYKWVGPIPAGERKRNLFGQWGDAILFAVIVATTFRTFTFEAFTIPTESMEKSLLVGDYLFVSKLSYGPRMPMTPVTFPFTHHTLPLTQHTPSFTNWFQLPYMRLPGFGKPQHGDAVVFNFPEGDTVVANFQNMSYYQLARMSGRENLLQRGRVVFSLPDGRQASRPTGDILVRPVDKQENYIKRCIGIPGDTLVIEDGQVRVNGVAQPLPVEGQYAYEFVVKDGFNKKILKDKYDITTTDVSEGNGVVEIPLTAANAEALSKFGNVESMTRENKPKGSYGEKDHWPIFPNVAGYDWTEDNFGPLWIPKAGATIKLDSRTLPLYHRAITAYEGNTLEERDGAIWINGEKADSYTFKQDYYWMMGDNRHRSLDSRFWGFVPYDHVVGKAVLVWLTVDPERGGFPGGIRWKRLFSRVR
ncbi:MAG TPA: S26 family signal peptidase [Flavobacteriales bacterium]|nr:S26 family signal peptidase [Flavobacteriales bacterium]